MGGSSTVSRHRSIPVLTSIVLVGGAPHASRVDVCDAEPSPRGATSMVHCTHLAPLLSRATTSNSLEFYTKAAGLLKWLNSAR